MFKLVPREAEPVEFRLLPGTEEEWASAVYVERSRLWDFLGVIPVLATVVLQLAFLAAAV